MKSVIMAKKSVQSQMFDENNIRIPTTSLLCGSCYVSAVKDYSDGAAIQIAFGAVKKAKKTTQGNLKKAGIESPLSSFREFRFDDKSDIETLEDKVAIKIEETPVSVGQLLDPEKLFKPGDMVSVTGISKGKGFQGVVRRHGFAGGPKTHGQSNRHRAPGSMGQTTTPGRTYKGKRMAGRMGGERITVRSLKVIQVTPNAILVKGLVPGAIGTVLEVRKTN